MPVVGTGSDLNQPFCMRQEDWGGGGCEGRILTATSTMNSWADHGPIQIMISSIYIYIYIYIYMIYYIIISINILYYANTVLH